MFGASRLQSLGLLTPFAIFFFHKSPVTFDGREIFPRGPWVKKDTGETQVKGFFWFKILEDKETTHLLSKWHVQHVLYAVGIHCMTTE